MVVPDSNWGWGVNEEHRAWGPQLYLCRQYQILFCLGVKQVEGGVQEGEVLRFWSRCLTLVAQEAPMSFSAEGQEPNQLLPNHVHHKQSCSQRTKYRKRRGRSGEAPLGPACNDCHTGL